MAHHVNEKFPFNKNRKKEYAGNACHTRIQTRHPGPETNTLKTVSALLLKGNRCGYILH
jgi:hypothetical protein